MKNTSISKNVWQHFAIFSHLLLAQLIGVTIGSLLFRWLPVIPVFSNPYEIVSPLVEQNYHPINNLIRYFVFLACPPLCWWLFYLLAKKMRWEIFLPTIASLNTKQTKDVDPPFQPGPKAWIICIALLCIGTLAQLSYAAYFDYRRLNDYLFFHEGEWLAPAQKWLVTGKIWTGSFFAHGAFYDVFSSGLAWKWFGVTSISTSRIFVSFLGHLITPANTLFFLCSAYFGFAYSKKRYSAAVFYALASLAFYELTLYWQAWDRRDLPGILGFCFFLYGMSSKKRWPMLVTGLMGTASWIYSIDRGAYFTAAPILVVILANLIERNKKSLVHELAWLFLGHAIGALLCILLLGWEEIRTGIQTTLFHFQMKDLSDGSAYPPPGFPITNYKFFRTRHTVPLFCIALQMVSMFALLAKNQWRMERNSQWITQLSFLLFSFIYYRSGLSRADEVHFRYVATFPIMGAFFCLCLPLLQSKIWNSRYVQVSLLAISTFYFVRNYLPKVQEMPQNIRAMPTNLSDFKKLPDEYFLYKWEKDTLAFLQKEFQDEPCFYSTASEPIWPYLLRKPSCGRFYLTWLLSDKRLQYLALEELKQANPGKILVHTPKSGDKMDGVPFEKRAKYLFGYINDHYEPFKEFRGWEVWKRKATP